MHLGEALHAYHLLYLTVHIYTLEGTHIGTSQYRRKRTRFGIQVCFTANASGVPSAYQFKHAVHDAFLFTQCIFEAENVQSRKSSGLSNGPHLWVSLSRLTRSDFRPLTGSPFARKSTDWHPRVPEGARASDPHQHQLCCHRSHAQSRARTRLALPETQSRHCPLHVCAQ